MRRIPAGLISGLLALSLPARAGDECVTSNDCAASAVCVQGECASSLEQRATGGGPSVVTVALYLAVVGGVLLAIRAQVPSQRPAAVAACVPPPR